MNEDIQGAVKEILLDIEKNGDLAVIKYSKKFDNFTGESFLISKKEIKEAYLKVDKKTLYALKEATKNIRAFAIAQFKQVKGFKLKTDFGILEQKVIPLSSVGCYVPGGNYPLPSTALMTVIPAKVAGVKEVIVCSPKITPIVIVAADIAGANKIFNLGGVQAIGAMSYGTAQIPRVDKIVGPGNKYVAEAKRQVFGEVGIDFIAGPSEVLIVADSSANPKLIAADILAQAEHDTCAKANLITLSKELGNRVRKELALQIKDLPTRSVAEEAIKSIKIIEVKTIEEAAKIANLIAPEHLELQIRNERKMLDNFENYGSMFLGENSAESLGDYCLGPNHTLPTSGAAKYTGGLSVRDFVKIVTIQKVTNPTKKIIDTASKLAQVEGLFAHKKSAEMRRKKQTK